MPSVRLKGLAKATAKLANGERVTYWYAWRGGPRLEGEPGSPAFMASYHRAINARPETHRGKIVALSGEFRVSAEFGKLSDKSKQAYLYYLRMIEDAFGDMPVHVAQEPEAKGDFYAWRDGMQATPRKADYAWQTLNRLFSWAKRRGRMSINPCEGGGRLYSADRTEKLWTADDLDRLFAVCAPEIRAVVSLAVLTAQRQGDLLALAWSFVEGGELRLRQNKRGRRVTLALYPELRALLDAIPKRATTMLTNSAGRPWTTDGFKTSFRKACQRAGIEGLTFHDLRGTAITHFALRGMSAIEIATIAGMSEKDVSTLLDKHYLGNRAAIARAAVERCLGNETGSVFAKRLQNGASVLPINSS